MRQASRLTRRESSEPMTTASTMPCTSAIIHSMVAESASVVVSMLGETEARRAQV